MSYLSQAASLACLTCFMLTASDLFAQRSAIDNQQVVNAAGSAYSPSGNVMRTYDNRFRGIEGSPYLMNDWKDAIVISEDGSMFRDLQVRYNIETDDVVLASHDGGPLLLPREKIAEFVLQDGHEFFRFVAITNPVVPEERAMFCQLLEDGPVQVYVRRRKYFVPGSNTLAFGHQDHGQYKFHKDRFYLRNRDTGEMLKVGRINAPVYTFLGAYKKELKELSKTREWYVSDPDALLGLIRHFNKLSLRS